MAAAGHDGATAAPSPPFGPFGRALLLLSKIAATAGGLVFVGLVAMSIVSIVGRKLFAAPVPGDVEMLQLFAAIACSTFFAYCHLAGGDVKVDFFTHNWHPAKVHALDAFGSFAIGAFGALIAWRTFASAISLKASGEETMLLGVPQWLGPMAMVPGFALMAVAGFYMMVRHLQQARAAHRADS